MLENLYGKTQVEAEARMVGLALRNSATQETAHPDNRDQWAPDNPTYGQCDLFTDYCKRVWGRSEGKWSQDAQILVWWAYLNHEAFLNGVRKNKLTVHYSFNHATYGEIDLSREQFPDQTYLHPRPKPLTHVAPVTKSWHSSSEIPSRRKIIESNFTTNLLSLEMPPLLTPEFECFLEELNI